MRNYRFKTTVEIILSVEAASENEAWRIVDGVLASGKLGARLYENAAEIEFDDHIGDGDCIHGSAWVKEAPQRAVSRNKRRA